MACLVDSPTESRNPRTADIDTLPTLDMLRLINAEDAMVARAVADVLPHVARAVELAVAAVRSGGRIHYFGAGTSGRLAAMDAAELPPTYGVSPALVVAHHAGGDHAIGTALASAEDDGPGGAIAARRVGRTDLAVGVTASGRTPYVLAALAAAAAAGARTVLLSGNPFAPFGRGVDVHIAVNTGPEVITGSTRMKAGTAAKLVLNMFSTAAMVRLGRTHSNMMVCAAAGNAKLRCRTVSMLVEATGGDPDTVEATLAEAGGDTRVALVTLLCGVPVARAAEAVDAGGTVRAALRLLTAAS